MSLRQPTIKQESDWSICSCSVTATLLAVLYTMQVVATIVSQLFPPRNLSISKQFFYTAKGACMIFYRAYMISMKDRILQCTNQSDHSSYFKNLRDVVSKILLQYIAMAKVARQQFIPSIRHNLMAIRSKTVM